MSQAEDASRFYDRISGVYDALSDKSERAAREVGLRLLAPSGNEQVLEIGFGTGHGVVEIAKLLSEEGRANGIDVSRCMLDIAMKRAEEEGVADRVNLRLGDAKKLHYGGGSFDAVFLSFTLELFSESDIPTVLTEISRVLKPAGRLGVVALEDDGHKAKMVDLYRFLHRHFPHIIDCQPIDARSYLKKAGFEIEASEKMAIWGLPVIAIVGRRPAH